MTGVLQTRVLGRSSRQSRRRLGARKGEKVARCRPVTHKFGWDRAQSNCLAVGRRRPRVKSPVGRAAGLDTRRNGLGDPMIDHVRSAPRICACTCVSRGRQRDASSRSSGRLSSALK
jgi:hypothetical protein